MKAWIKYVEGHTYVARSDSNHWLPLDLGTAGGGCGAANDPFQTFVIGIGGCVSVDIVNIIMKSRKMITRMEMEVDATRAATPPKILRSLHFHVRIETDATEETVRRALQLSLTKYCSASLSIDRSVPFRAQITLNNTAGEPWEIPRDAAIYEREE